MPLAALVCHCTSCRGEVELPPAEALEHAANNHGRFTYELLSAMLAQVQDRGTRISTTTLSTKCLRSEVLQRTEPYTLDPVKGYASFRGTMFHGQLESHARPGSREEPRYHKYLDGLGAFSGSPDLVDVPQGTLYDYKFNKENPRFDYAWKGHVEQGQINRWLADTADYVEWRGEVFALTEAGVEWIGELGDSAPAPGDWTWDLRTNIEMFRPVDWQGIYVVYMDDKGPKPILLTKSVEVPKVSGEGTKKARVADIWDDARVEALVRERYAEVQKAFANILTNEDPPPISDDFWGWGHPLCDWCVVRDSCVNHFIQSTRQEAVLHIKKEKADSQEAAA